MRNERVKNSLTCVRVNDKACGTDVSTTSRSERRLGPFR